MPNLILILEYVVVVVGFDVVDSDPDPGVSAETHTDSDPDPLLVRLGEREECRQVTRTVCTQGQGKSPKKRHLNI